MFFLLLQVFLALQIHAQVLSPVGLDYSWKLPSRDSMLQVPDVNVNFQSSVGLGSSWKMPSQDSILQILDVQVFFDSITLTVTLIHKISLIVLADLIWWAKVTRPVDTNGTLTLQQDGNLVQRHSDGRIVWQTGTAGLGVKTMEILSSGNLVLLTSNKSVVWQSFNFPTDVLMLNQTLKVGGRLESAVSLDYFNVVTRFYLQVEPTAVYLYVTERDSYSSDRYASFCQHSGNQISHIQVQKDGLKCFDSSSKLLASKHFNSVNYLKLSTDGDFLRVLSLTKTSLMPTVNEKCGSPVAGCGVNGYCTYSGQCSCFFTASFNFLEQSRPSEGCIPQSSPICYSNGQNNAKLVAFPGVTNLVADFNKDQAPSVASIEVCKSLCLRNCSCSGLVFYHKTNACVLLTKIYTSWNQSSEMTTFLKVGSTFWTRVGNLPPSRKWQIASFILAGAIFIFLACMIKNHFKEKAQKRLTPSLPQAFKYKELVSITENFKIQLGEGGFGTVFKGTLLDGTEVAVKQLTSATEGMKQFEAEVRSTGSILHKNLVKLLGFCAYERNFYLIYEFLHNMSLDRWLLSTERSLDWHTRLLIAVDIASGLHYLHESCREQVLHLDIKPQNVLLDAAFRAKICDFGLSRLVNRGGGSIHLTLRGTPGYMAPEWVTGKVTDRTDVYSFGIVLLEIVSGRKVAPLLPMGQSTLSLVRTESLADLDTLIQHVDQRLFRTQSELDIEQVKGVACIGLSCIADEPHERPTMEKVLQMLEALV